MLNYRPLLSSVLMLCLISPLVSAKGAPSDWNNVRILDRGTYIIVKTKLGEKYEGRLDSTTADRMSLMVKIPHVMQRIIELRKDEVKEVRKKIPPAASMAIGAGIGFGAGLALGAIADSKDKYGEDPNLGKLAFGLLGLTIGAAIGTAVSFTSRKVYEAP